MTLTLIQGTIHKSLTCFDFELAAKVKSKAYADANGVIVSIVEQHGFTYLFAKQTNRRVVVTGDEEAHLKFAFVQDSETVHEVYIHYFKTPLWTSSIIDFLLEGTIPKADVLTLTPPQSGAKDVD